MLTDLRRPARARCTPIVLALFELGDPVTLTPGALRLAAGELCSCGQAGTRLFVLLDSSCLPSCSPHCRRVWWSPDESARRCPWCAGQHLGRAGHGVCGGRQHRPVHGHRSLLGPEHPRPDSDCHVVLLRLSRGPRPTRPRRFRTRRTPMVLRPARASAQPSSPPRTRPPSYKGLRASRLPRPCSPM